MISNQEIEFWENEYLSQIEYMLNIDMKKMLDGFATKEQIRPDWERFLWDETSDFATWSERIFYWLFNQFWKPNSSPIWSDMFFETYNAYVHIDIKTVKTSNIWDFNTSMFVWDNQNSYRWEILTRAWRQETYEWNLPQFYTKVDWTSKICLTYFITILYNQANLDIQVINVLCMPNWALNEEYWNNILKAWKNPWKIRYNFHNCPEFKLLAWNKKRIRIVYWKENMEEIYRRKLTFNESIYNNQ